MRCDEVHKRSDKAGQRQTVIDAGRAAPELARQIAAILSRAEGGLSYLARPDPDLAEIRHLLGEIALAGRRAALAAELKPIPVERRPVSQVKPDAAAPGAPDPTVLKGGLSRWQQRQALRLMTLVDLEPPRIAEVAAACRLSRGYFIKAFKQSFGVTPRRWHQLYRIEQSKQLLLSQDLPIAEIALACGFADQSHLTRVFNQIVGTPPARWRRQSYG